jgi:hypothetical protein
MDIVLVVYFPLLAAIRLRGYLAMSALLEASWAAGWLLGGSGSDNRKTFGAYNFAAQRRRRPGHRDRQLRRHGGRHCCPGLWDLRDCCIVAAGPGLRPSELNGEHDEIAIRQSENALDAESTKLAAMPAHFDGTELIVSSIQRLCL